MAVKFRVLLRPMETSDKTSDAVVKAIVVLHNYLLEFSLPKYNPSRFADGEEETGIWRRHIIPLEQATDAIRKKGANNYALKAAHIRDKYSNFFSIGL
jgi:hypothetical protein